MRPVISTDTAKGRSAGTVAHRASQPTALTRPSASLRLALLWAVAFTVIAVTHHSLLRLPYYWDEGGYYIPAALDFYHRWTLVPEFTNAHPPLPNVVLGLLWHVFGYRILVTRLCAATFAAAGIAAVFELARRLLGSVPVAAALALLTACYPIWFAQSTLAHADIFAAAFTLAGFVVYLAPAAISAGSAASSFTHSTASQRSHKTTAGHTSSRRRLVLLAVLFSLAALSKETAIVEPATLGALELWRLLRSRDPATRRGHLRLIGALAAPLLPLLAWYAWHHHVTGFTFGNPEYLRYNATANFNAAHILQALRYRAIHLLWQRMIWVPIALTVLCLMLPSRDDVVSLRPDLRSTLVLLIVANWIAFSVLGGALLTRYLLPVYPLLLLLAVDVWHRHTRHWPVLASITAAAFVAALWINPNNAFAPEDNLTYRDMIRVQQAAIAFTATHFPDAHTLTAWPVAADMVRPELGYTSRKLDVVSLDHFTTADVLSAGRHPERFDTMIAFPTHYVPLPTRAITWPQTAAQRAAAAAEHELSAEQIAHLLGGTVVFEQHRGAEWAAVLRFPRSYSASLSSGR